MALKPNCLLFALTGILCIGHHTVWLSRSVSAGPSRPMPPQGVPPNRAQPGGGLDDGLQSCSNADQPFTALIPAASPVLTTEEHPSFWFYVPDSPEQVKQGHFVLLTADEKTRLYEATVDLSNAPGVVSVTLPESANTALQTGELYHWYFKVDCQAVQSREAARFDFFVDGWIQRIEDTTENEQSTAASSPLIWHDVLDQTAEAIALDPDDVIIQSRWAALLGHIGFDDLATVDIVGPALPIAEPTLEPVAN